MPTQSAEGRNPALATCAGLALFAAVAVAVAPVATVAPAGAAGRSAPSEYGCPIFPPSNSLNEEVARAPVDPSSARYVASIGLTAHVHPDFGRDAAYGIPISVVPRGQPRAAVRFTDYADESDAGPYPIPPSAPIEGAGEAGDRHVLVRQRGSCRLYELYDARRDAKGGWSASSGAIFDLRSNALRPAGWTSADAAGLPILPLLVRYPEVAAGRIDHALRVTVPHTQRAYVHPATHFASSSSDASLPPMGLRLRLKADYSLAGFSGQALVIVRALKRFGLIVADNGSPWYVTGAPSARWNEASLQQLKRIPGAAFEAVRSGRIFR